MSHCCEHCGEAFTAARTRGCVVRVSIRMDERHATALVEIVGIPFEIREQIRGAS